MSNYEGNIKTGHPVAGIILGVLGIAVAVILTLLFGVVTGAIATVLGVIAVLLGINARKNRHGGVGAIVTGSLAILLAIVMTFTTVGLMKEFQKAAAESSVAPTFSECFDNPYLGLSSALLKAGDEEKAKTIMNEMDALREYMDNKGKTTTAETLPAAK